MKLKTLLIAMMLVLLGRAAANASPVTPSYSDRTPPTPGL
jgi:hypothetical protein